MINVAINGFGRIGRLSFRKMMEDSNFNIVAINDLTDAEQLAYLLKYDTAHRTYKKNISFDENNLIIDNKKIKIFKEMDPNNLPWNELNVDIVLECTGKFVTKEKAEAHIKAGAKKVIISAPAKGDLKTIVYNVNHETLNTNDNIISAASCTTNCLAPVCKVLDEEFGIKIGYMTTVHAYTNDQSILDLAHKKGAMSRRGRAAASNIIPSSTGAASALGLVLPNLLGKLDGSSLRVPTITGSVVELIAELNKKTTSDEINEAFKNKQDETLKITFDPIVSSDVIGEETGALVDGILTSTLDVNEKQMVKVVAWYDNEMGYSSQLVRLAKYVGNL
jgi:glyceraldehyde 3-phosphate dehydrogenase